VLTLTLSGDLRCHLDEIRKERTRRHDTNKPSLNAEAAVLAVPVAQLHRGIKRIAVANDYPATQEVRLGQPTLRHAVYERTYRGPKLRQNPASAPQLLAGISLGQPAHEWVICGPIRSHCRQQSLDGTGDRV